MLAISGTGTVLLGWLTAAFWIDANIQRTDAERILRSTGTEDRFLESARNWATERSLVHAALKAPAALGNDARQIIGDHRRAADEALKQALEDLGGNSVDRNLADAMSRVADQFQRLQALRADVDDQTGRPSNSREVTIVEAWFPAITNLIVATQQLRVAATYRASITVRDIEALQGLKHAVWAMSEFAERESALIAGTIAAPSPPRSP